MHKRKEDKYFEEILELDGDAFHYDHREDDDYYSQAGNLFRIMNSDQQQVLFENTARQIGAAEKFIQERHISNCFKADSDYGNGVAKALGINPNDLNLS